MSENCQVQSPELKVMEIISAAIQLAGAGDWNRVGELLKVARSYNIQQRYLEYLTGLCRVSQGDYVGGVAALNRELELFPDNDQAYDLMVKVLASIPLGDIYGLSQNLSLHTKEVRGSNDFYGHAATLKKFLGLKNSYVIQAVIEHGCTLDPYYWADEVINNFPHLFVWSEFRRQVFQSNNPDKIISKIGPVICYANPILTNEQIKAEKERLGRNALYIPTHSTVCVTSNYDIPKSIETVKELKKEFNSVRVCLYWKDILNGMAKYYQDAGFECVTCGQMYDPSFLSRQKAFYEIADVIVISDPGCTSLVSAVGIGKPVCVIKQDYEIKPNVEGFKENHTTTSFISDPKTWTKNIEEEILNLFGSITLQLSGRQKEFAAYYLGTYDVKTKEELHDLFLRAEADSYRL